MHMQKLTRTSTLTSTACVEILANLTGLSLKTHSQKHVPRTAVPNAHSTVHTSLRPHNRNLFLHWNLNCFTESHTLHFVIRVLRLWICRRFSFDETLYFFPSPVYYVALAFVQSHSCPQVPLV